MPNELDAGRELDALIAEKVMGWKVNGHDSYYRWWGSPPGWKEPQSVEIPHYSTAIAAAWTVVEKLGLWVGPFVKGEWWCFQSVADYLNSRNISKAPSGQLAICRAALTALAQKG
jgi:hypothetical protein